MNSRAIRGYAPQARRDFIQAMTDRAAFYGLTATKIEPVVEKGDVAVIGGRSHPRAVATKRKALEDRIGRHGFGPTMEALAYTWFNRLVAVRFMELHGYLDHGYRVLSRTTNRTNNHESRQQGSDSSSFVGFVVPEILEHAEHVDLPGLKKEAVIDLKLAGNKEGELYRLLLTAQCNALHAAMPFLFERIEDETELLLPDNLLHSDSLIRKLVGEIDEEDWQPVEIIGWLYQFYISDRKDEVIGKVVASEDIPAATQLFTPNWIVKYLVQNTLGRLWLATYPHSALRKQMEYYIEPAEQTPEVQGQLKAITPTSLNPEELTFLDPACGSAHILVEAYDVFKAIYQERGYRAKDIPALILKKNLFGLEIDDRAAQLAAFALMMKARADDRRIFDGGAKPNVVSLQETTEFDADSITEALNEPVAAVELPPSGKLFEDDNDLFSKKNVAVTGDVQQADIAALVGLFQHAKTFGSLIQIPSKLGAKLPEIEKRTRLVAAKSDTFARDTAARFLPLLQQAQLLAYQYDAVAANPPYMGGKYFNEKLKEFTNECFKEAKADLCTCFIERCFRFVKSSGFVGQITMQGWMFIASFEKFRTKLVQDWCIQTLAHLGPHAFPAIGGQVVQVVAFAASAQRLPDYRGKYKRLTEGESEAKEKRFHTTENYAPKSLDFSKIPGSPVAYWVSDAVREAFSASRASAAFYFGQTTKTTENSKYTRLWWEIGNVEAACQKSFRPFAMGGQARKWYGNRDWLVRWGAQSINHYRTGHNARITPSILWEKAGITWTDITGAINTFRVLESGDIPCTSGPAIYSDQSQKTIHAFLAFLNCKVASELLRVLNPTLHVNPQDVLNLPLPRKGMDTAAPIAEELTGAAKADWNSHETAWAFQSLPVIAERAITLEQSQRSADSVRTERFQRVKSLEESINSVFINAFGLQHEITPEVPDDQITLYRPDRAEDIKRLLSYAIGCMMGRYSLDKLGLVYAHSGNQGFDPSQYKTFRADEDGIIPLLETDWGIRDDATNRLVAFVGVAWPKDHLEENLKFIADSLGPNNGEQARDTIRRYLATGFYKHHLSMYKKRPIYWLFSSGKQRAFQCLVYLHRYHEGTLARMRTEYVIPLQGKLAARIEQLEGDKAKATSTSHRNKLQRQQSDLLKQQTELAAFEEKLKHAADQKISLDLDDGVKANYAKFGDLLAESKAITGGKDEE